MAKLGDLVVSIGANTKELNAKLGQVRKNMRSMSSNFTAVGRSMTRGITMPLLAIGAGSVKLAVDFQSAMASVKAITGSTGSEFKALEQSAKDLGASTIFTARDVAALQLEYSRLGFSAAQILLVQEATLNLAQATGSDLAQAAEVAGSTLKAFGFDASETIRVADIMAASFGASALNIDTFQDSMKFVAPDARAAGVSIEEVSAMLAVLANSGIKGSQAGTALRRILQEMQGTSGTLTERFAELNEAGLDVQGSMDEVGRRAGTSLLVLANGSDQISSLTTEFENSEGAAKAMADVMNDTAKGGIKAMTSALEGAGIALGDVLMPFVRDAANFVKDLATKFNELSVDTKESIVIFAGIAAALGPLMIILPQLIAGLPLIASGFALITGPLGLAVGGFIALGLAVDQASKMYNGVPDRITQINAAVKDQTTEIRYLVGQYKDEGKSLKDREKILERLAILDFKHFGNLEAENTTYGDLVKNLDNYTKSLRRNYLEKSFSAEGTALFTTLAADEAAIRAEEIMNQRMRDVLDEANRFTKAAAAENVRLSDVRLRFAQKARDKTLESIEKFEQDKQALLEKYATPEGETAEPTGGGGGGVVVGGGGGGGVSGALPAPGSIDELKNRVSELTNQLNAAVIGSDTFKTKQTELAAATLALDEALGNTADAVVILDDAITFPIGSLGQMKERLSELQTELQFLNPLSQEFADKMAQIDEMSILVNGTMEEMKESVNETSNAFKNLGQNISDALVDAVFEAKNFGDSLIEIGKQILKTLLSEAIANAIVNGSSSMNVANQASGGLTIPGFIAGAVGAVKGAFGGVPALASGGLAFGETMSIVGDNKNAAIDPEVIAPLSKLRQYMGGGNTNVYGRISGDDIVISNNRASRDRNRYE